MIDREKIPLHWVNRLSILSRASLKQRFHEAGYSVSAEEWAMLLVLWAVGPQTPNKLANLTFKDRTTVTRLINSMVKKSFVSRSEDLNDRRRSIIQLTPYGEELEGILVPIAKVFVKELTSDISQEDLATTMKVLKVMTNRLL